MCDKANKQKSELCAHNWNNTRTLTQQSSLVAPSEVHVSMSPALTAEPVLTPNGNELKSLAYNTDIYLRKRVLPYQILCMRELIENSKGKRRKKSLHFWHVRKFLEGEWGGKVDHHP